MSNALADNLEEIHDAMGGTRLRQAIVSFVTLMGMFTIDGTVPSEFVKASLRISDDLWEREAKRLYEEASMWSQGPADGYITGLIHTLARYAPAGVGGRPAEKMWLKLRRHMHYEIFDDQDPACLGCGAQDVSLALDHVVPVSRGGSNHPLNFMWLCIPCNSSKGTKTWEEWRAQK